MPSLNLLLELSQVEREQQLSHFESLDQKAGIVLGFAGVLIAVGSDANGVWRALALVFSTAAAASAVSAFWPRDYPVLRPSRLRHYLSSEAEFTRLTVLDTMESMINETRHVLAVKARRLKIALISLAVAAAAYAGGVAAI